MNLENMVIFGEINENISTTYLDKYLRKYKTFTYFFFFLKVLAPLIIIYLFIWLCWVFVSVRGLPLAAASGGHSSSRCTGLSLSRPLLLRSTGSRRAGSVVVAHGPSCSAACGIFPDQGSNPCPLHQQADSQPLRHQGSPHLFLMYILITQQQVDLEKIIMGIFIPSSLRSCKI